MSSSTRRRAKRRPPKDAYPSSASVEFISVTRQNGVITKKRIIEKTKFDARPDDDTPIDSDIPIDNDHLLPASGQSGMMPQPQVTGGSTGQKASRGVSTKLSEWLPNRPRHLGEVLRQEAPPPTTSLCVKCQNPAAYRCLGCLRCRMMCRGCLVSSHEELPFHPIQEWNGKFFVGTTLTALGLVVDLGHDVGETCALPSLRDLLVFDLSGAHRLVVRYCGCGNEGASVPKDTQLLRVRWFPATIDRPSTAFSFNLLDFFQTLQNRNKCNPYDFYHTIIQLTDAAFLDREIFRYNEITLVSRIWSHLQLLKRGGAVHLPCDIESAPNGSVAVDCPACPHPGKNTTELPRNELWKNTLFVGVDACFKLKLKDRGFDDPELGSGLAYMVNASSYSKHLQDAPESTETISTCGSDLHAVNEAYTKHSQGYIATGVAAVSCRHAFVLPNGVVDLQKGERQINIDYAVASALTNGVSAGITDVVVTYDIACQWGKYFKHRLSTYPSIPPLDLAALKSFRVAVPKFHLVGHKESCQSSFNLAFMDKVGMTHGEGVETIWSHSTSLAIWSRENGPGARHLILDDHWSGWNWAKLVGLRQQLKNMLNKAWEWSKTQREVADAMTVTWKKFVPGWMRMLHAYKKNGSMPNPFEEPNVDVALAELKRQLANEDSAKCKAGAKFAHETTPSTFIERALDIEALQRQLKEHDDESSFHERRRALSRGINAIREPQRLYMKGAAHLFDRVDAVALADHPGNVKLWLPSELPASFRDGWCAPGLPQIEFRLRYATATSALEVIRRFRRFAQAVITKTQSHISTTQKTRNHGQLDRIQQRIDQAAATYRASWCAIGELAPNEEFGPWKTRLKELRREDIRGPGRGESEKSESHHVPSWIWQTAPQTSTSDQDQDFCDALRVEWCKAQERAARYKEEVHLVVEEMRRTLAFFEWTARRWESRAVSPVDSEAIDPETKKGISAYAHKQAAVYRGMAEVFVKDWYKCLEEKSLGKSWLSQYPSPPPKRRRLFSNVKLYHPVSAPSAGTPNDDEIESDLGKDDVEREGDMDEDILDGELGKAALEDELVWELMGA